MNNVDRARRLYDAEIAVRVETAENIGKLIAIDTDSGDYEIAPTPDYASALIRFRSQHPSGKVALLRIGSNATFTRGFRPRAISE